MNLADLTVSLFFSGLIAFVPNKLDKPTQMTAYAVKPLAGECVHAQYLWYRLSAGTCADLFNHVDGFCRYNLGDDDLSFQSRDHAGGLYDEGQHVDLPRKASQFHDFYYVVRLSAVNKNPVRIRPWEEIVGKVGARVTFGWVRASSCVLDQGGQDCDTAGHDFTFVDRLHREGARHHRQAIAKAARFDINVPGASPFVIEVRHNHQVDGAPVELKIPCPAGACPDVFITDDTVNSSCGLGPVAGHFAAFNAITDASEDLVPRSLGDLRDIFAGNYNTCKFPGTGERPMKKAPVKATSNPCNPINAEFFRIDAKPVCPMAVIDP